MTPDTDVERYVEKPSLLVTLCRDVIERLDNEIQSDETASMEAQLREVSRAIEKLDKQHVPVPDALRTEKTRLAAALSENGEPIEALNNLADELEGLLKDLKARIGRSTSSRGSKKPRAKRSKSPKTDSAILRKLIIEALRQHGGSARVKEVLEYMETKLEGQLLPGDLEWREATNECAWQNNAKWQRYAMTQDGTLKTGSPRGVWELSEKYR